MACCKIFVFYIVIKFQREENDTAALDKEGLNVTVSVSTHLSIMYL